MRQFKIENRLTQRTTHTIDVYLSEVSKYPILTPTEEEELAIRVGKGDMAARNRLIQCNLRFVVSVAKGYNVKGVMLEDLINEGNVGLATAAERFDSTRGFRFISYAVWWVRQSIMKYIQEYSDTVRRPMNFKGEAGKIYGERQRVAAETGEIYDDVAIMEMLGYTEKDIQRHRQAAVTAFRGDAPITSDSTDTFFDFIAAEDHTLDDLNNDDRSKQLTRAISKFLSEREQKIVRALFGIGEQPKTLQDLSIEMKLTRERVRQISVKAIGKLKSSECMDVLREYL